MSKSCIICGGEESEGELLREAPCGTHWVCADDIASFFERAAANESLFPPKCCDQIFLLSEYEDYVPFETAWAYQLKEQGEYAVQARYEEQLPTDLWHLLTLTGSESIAPTRSVQSSAIPQLTSKTMLSTSSTPSVRVMTVAN